MKQKSQKTVLIFAALLINAVKATPITALAAESKAEITMQPLFAETDTNKGEEEKEDAPQEENLTTGQNAE